MIVWLVFAVVVIIRLLVPSEHGLRLPWMQWQPEEPRRFRRPPTRVQPPVAEVPADLWRLHIEMASRDVQKLRSYHWNGWRGQPQPDRPEVLATVREGGVTYTNVALHLKGAAGSFRPFDDKPSLTLHFSKHARRQRFHGYHKISLNNSVQDPSFLCEAISRELFEAAGVPVPRADHATVLINGRDLGLYVLTEGWGKPFLRRHFKNVSGNLYDGGFVQDVNPYLDTNSGDHPDDRTALERLIAAAEEPDSRERWARLGEVLDLDRFIALLAMEIMTCHWDGYAMNHNNYRIFHDLETDKLIFMPHGLDQMFGTFRSTPTSTIYPPMQGFVARAVMSTTEGRRRYVERIAALRTQVFVPERLTARVRELARRIRPTLAAYGPDLASQHDHQVEYLCSRIVERARSISEQLAAPAETLKFDSSGAARLSGWRSRTSTQSRGTVQFGRVEHEGRRQLHIAVGEGGGAGSWRTRVWLEPGRYHFEGRARTRGVGLTGGIALRVSGLRSLRFGASDEQWTTLNFPFMVDEPLAEVELICEFQAAGGEAWFEEESLRLVRE